MKQLTTEQFFDTQFREYSLYDNERSIPNLIDGLKISQRKCIHTTITKNITKEFKVAQLASLVAGTTAYHHGEAGLGGVICGLAQNFTGSNNHNFLEPIGQFGSRLSPIPAAHRYIFTHLSKNFRDLFKKEDDIILEYLTDDDQEIEPKYFIPIIPGILINGSEGIGTGFASRIFPRNIDEIIKYIKNKLQNKSEKINLLPYYKNFKGEVKFLQDSKYQISGVIERVNTTTVKITELPVGMYLEDIKKHLNKLIESGFIKDYDDNSTEESFDIDVYFLRTTLNTHNDEELKEKLKLITSFSENLTCWLPNKKLKKFDSVESLIDYFIDFRLEKYSERKLKQISIEQERHKDLNEKIRFIRFYLENVDLFKNSGKKELEDILNKNNFDFSMLELKIYNLTKDKIKELIKSIEEIKNKIVTLEKAENTSLWLDDLN